MKTTALYEPRSKYTKRSDGYETPENIATLDRSESSTATAVAPLRPGAVETTNIAQNAGSRPVWSKRDSQAVLCVADLLLFATAASVLVGSTMLLGRALFLGLGANDETWFGHAMSLAGQGGPQGALLGLAAILSVVMRRRGMNVRLGVRIASGVVVIAWLAALAGGAVYLHVQKERWAEAGLVELGNRVDAAEAADPKNAVLVLMKASDWVASRESKTSEDAWDNGDRSGMIPTFRLDSQWSKVAAALREASGRPDWNWKVIPETSNDFRGNGASHVIRAAQAVLASDLAAALDSGDRERAIQDLTASLNIVRRAAPVLGYLPYEECLRIREEDSRIAVTLFKDNDQGFEKVMEAFEHVDVQEWTRRALADRPFVYDELCEFREGGGSPLLSWSGLGDIEQGVKMAAARDRAASRIGVPVHQWDMSASRVVWSQKPKANIDRSDLARCDHEMSGEALARQDMLLIALGKYRREHGSFPSSLQQLGPVPADPFDGRPMRYQLANGEALISSVGTYRLRDFPQRFLEPNHPHERPDAPVAMRPSSFSPDQLRSIMTVIGADGSIKPD